MSSRIIVKNLPKEYSEEEIRNAFSHIPKHTHINITDVRLARTPAGLSRRFAFVGFGNSKDAEAAISYFNNTFFGSTKVSIEPALPKSHSLLPRTADKSRITEAPRQPVGTEIRITKASLHEEKKRKLFEIYETSEQNAASNPQLLEFLAAMKPRSQTRTWSNDDSGSPTLISPPTYSDDELYQDLPDKTEVPETNPAELPEEQLGNEEDVIKETGRLFLRSLVYATSSDGLSADLESLFAPFGPISDINVPVSADSRRPKGIAFIQFMLPEHALKAYRALNHSFFQGRILCIYGAKEKKMGVTSEDLGFKASKERRLKDGAAKASESWNSLFFSPDSVLEATARQLGVNKREILNHGLSSSELASRVALSETQIISQTKKYLEEEGIRLGGKATSRSKTAFLIKNISFSMATKEVLEELLKPFGSISRLTIPPTRAIAIVEYAESSSAKSAFASLAYKKVAGLPLFLEWAPEGMLGPAKEKQPEIEPLNPDNVSAAPISGTSLFIKNINFSTTQRSFERVFAGLNGFVSSSIATKNLGGKKISSGFGFAEFSSAENAQAALESPSLQNVVLDGHRLSVALSQGTRGPSEPRTESTKLLVRNVAFEATAADIRSLFSPFGQIKRVRLPRKHDGTHRGFCFVEFISTGEARAAFDSVKHSHLYGRHLVLEWADDSTDTRHRLDPITLSRLKPSGHKKYIADGSESEPE